MHHRTKDNFHLGILYPYRKYFSDQRSISLVVAETESSCGIKDNEAVATLRMRGVCLSYDILMEAVAPTLPNTPEELK
jgi:hypothetical protein